MMVTDLATPPGLPATRALPNLARVRLLEGSAELLLGRLRLHAKRVRALAATFRREIRRIQTAQSAELGRIDQHLDRIATQMTIAQTALDQGFAVTFAGVGTLEGLAFTVDIEHPDHTVAQRIASQAHQILGELRARHAEAHTALLFVVEQLVVSANNLAIVVSQPGAQSQDQLSIVIRQMRNLSQITAEIGSRLDIFVQNQSAALQELLPSDSVRETVLASLRAQGATLAPRTQEGAG